ncbi:MAG: 30S ribosomal protein S20 [Phycisphaerae bacterium]
MSKRSLTSLKRVRQNKRRAARNKSRTTAIKTQLRKLTDALAAGDAARAETEFRNVSQLLDRAAAHGVIHRNKAGRSKGRLARRVSAIRKGADKGAKSAKAK